MRCLIAGAVSALVCGGLPLSAGAVGGDAIARYKQHVNSVCIKTTPKLVKALRAAKRASSPAALVAAFDHYVAIGLGQDRAILHTPVPTGARAEMAPFFRLVRQSDSLAVRAAHALKAGNQSRFNQLTAQLDALGKKYDRVADALGLRGCGSDQTRALNRV